jgi:hypothetical protein
MALRGRPMNRGTSQMDVRFAPDFF